MDSKLLQQLPPELIARLYDVEIVEAEELSAEARRGVRPSKKGMGTLRTGPNRGQAGRPRRACSHPEERRFRRVDSKGRVRTECRDCATIRQRERYREAHPGWQANKRRPVKVT